MILALFFMSGACGLMHEIVWTRLFRHVLGNSTYATSMVLCTFMGGLALGGLLGGMIMSRKRLPTLPTFAALELGVAVCGAAMPMALELMQPLYGALYKTAQNAPVLLNLGRFVFSGTLLLLPATLMGATLPVLSAHLARHSADKGKAIGQLYASNTLGAVVGAFCTGFIILPQLGVTGTVVTASAGNLLLAAAILAMGRRFDSPDASPAACAEEAAQRSLENSAAHPALYSRAATTALLLGYGFSGFAALSYEVCWTRVLAMMIGSSVYAFTMILTVFIAGLALGSAVCSRYADRFRDPLLALAAVQCAIAFSSLAALPVLGEMPFRITRAIAHFSTGFWSLTFVELGFVSMVMLPPTAFMGAAFPLAVRVFNLRNNDVPLSVGTVYSSNTLGTILGSFAAGFVLIPWAGVRNTLLLSVGINVLTGVAFLAFSPSLRGWRKASAQFSPLALLVGGVFLMPSWSIEALTFGPFYEALRLPESTVQSSLELSAIAAKRRVLFHADGPDATITVKEFDDASRALYINGKPDASSHGDLPSQLLVAHLPLMAHRKPEDVLVVGLASGVTAGSATLHPVARVDCLEISPTMIEASHFFDEFNNRPLDNPKVNLVVADGRNHLAMSGKLYDVIISEPSNPYFAGVADLFTREYFSLMRHSLKPGGVACAWVQAYLIDLESFRSIVATFREVFPHMTFWKSLKGDCMMVGSLEPIRMDWDVLSGRMEDVRIATDLQRIGISSPADLLGHFMADGQDLAGLTGNASIHTDDNVLIEYAAPKALVGKNIFQWDLLESLESVRSAELPFVAGQGAEWRAAIDAAEGMIRARGEVFAYHLLRLKEGHERAMPHLLRAAALNGRDAYLLETVEQFRGDAYASSQRNDTKGAMRILEDILAIWPQDPKAHYNLGQILRQGGDMQEARAHYERAVAADPDYMLAHYNLAMVLAGLGKHDQAEVHFREALRVDPDFVPAMVSLADMLLDQPIETGSDNVSKAHALAERAVTLTARSDMRSLMALGAAFERMKKADEARETYMLVLQLAKANGNSGMAEVVTARIRRNSGFRTQ
jgi:spermidine synthase